MTAVRLAVIIINIILCTRPTINYYIPAPQARAKYKSVDYHPVTLVIAHAAYYIREKQSTTLF